MWLSWRRECNKPLALCKSYSSQPHKFIKCKNEELTNFLAFKDASRFLQANDNYFVPRSFLLETALQETVRIH